MEVCKGGREKRRSSGTRGYVAVVGLVKAVDTISSVNTAITIRQQSINTKVHEASVHVYHSPPPPYSYPPPPYPYSPYHYPTMPTLPTEYPPALPTLPTEYPPQGPPQGPPHLPPSELAPSELAPSEGVVTSSALSVSSAQEVEKEQKRIMKGIHGIIYLDIDGDMDYGITSRSWNLYGKCLGEQTKIMGYNWRHPREVS